MMRWFHNNFNNLGKLGEMIRGPSSDLHSKVSAVVDKLNLADEIFAITERDPLTKSAWNGLTHATLIQATAAIVHARHPDTQNIDDVKRIRDIGRGTSTFIGSVLSSMRNGTGQRRRQVETNDIADAAHAIYAPYVRFFRADRYMAPIVQREVATYRTNVVNRLEDLPRLVEAAL